MRSLNAWSGPKWWVSAFATSLASLSCASGAPIPEPAAPLTEPSALCTTETESAPCLAPEPVAAWLRYHPLNIIRVDETGGSSGAKLLTVDIQRPNAKPVRLRAKWREYGDSLFNDARKEIAAYAVQQLIFAPHEYVVPPTSGRCFDLRYYETFMKQDAEESFPETSCVYGSLSYWLEDVKPVAPYTDARFQEDSAYRKAIADNNLFTFIIRHGDTHDGNFLEAKHAATTRIYSPDNAIAFNPLWRNPLDLVGPSWYELRVPALRRVVVNRLRNLTRSDLAWLGSIEQYQVRNGRLVPVKPNGRIPGTSAVRRQGGTLQLGLSETEISNLYERIREVIARVDRGAPTLF